VWGGGGGGGVGVGVCGIVCVGCGGWTGGLGVVGGFDGSGCCR